MFLKVKVPVLGLRALAVWLVACEIEDQKLATTTAVSPTSTPTPTPQALTHVTASPTRVVPTETPTITATTAVLPTFTPIPHPYQLPSLWGQHKSWDVGR